MCLFSGRGLGGGGYFIVMEYLDFRGQPNQADLGRGLARMHLAEPTVGPHCSLLCRRLAECADAWPHELQNNDSKKINTF